MQRFSHTDPAPEALRGAIVALGNFDGFHFGHQAVVGRAIAKAAHEGRPAVVATFDPHPVRHFRPDAKPFRLTTLDQREELFAHAGADGMLVFAFDDALASLTAAEFVELLADRLQVAGVVTGEDFTFGKGREGDVAKLAELGAAKGMSAEAVGAVAMEEAIVSSSRIREALQAGDPATATRLLTRPFAVRAKVVHGDKRGRELGWPTANMELGQYLRPAYGIYATRVRLPDGAEHDAVSNLGVRPMFDPPKELLETFIFDFEGDLYGQEIEVQLHHYLRPEAAFHDLEALKRQMDADGAEARRLLSQGRP
ncbi:bifunctional riboflavin kinase/FAD synthetase [Sphingomicrobium astaxanthinifaciens]|uniref:bifunctional riboflavin kinase/FAD synthetase n=1 Tax=Sphingomicrobium astaxanthinifaciens TaxID=1227949 RepID=UPI001FCAA355|nr:bifunctional riboflavin kinase/FAD synthetase [Sphingomicrobium astaxanthinifaciens]MCJ7421594.1 bifunctional riboflavin kinase/FAD synthetase [Sphingomicrobium astaxanthinifaciens]